MPDKPPKALLIGTFISTVLLGLFKIPGIIGLIYCYYKMREVTLRPNKWFLITVGAGLAVLGIVFLIGLLMLGASLGKGRV